MDIKDLRYFLAVYRTGSFSRAATELETVQSNVSARILALERDLGVQLFARGHRDVSPTPHGKRLYAPAARIVTALGTLEKKMRRWRRAAKHRGARAKAISKAARGSPRGPP